MTTKSSPKRKAAAPKPAPAPEAAQTDDAKVESTGAATNPAMKLRDLVDRVSDSTGGKKKDVKEIVEATLNEMGGALARGEEMNLPGIGKVRVARSADKDGRAIMVLKVRGPGAPKNNAAKDGLAEAEEDV
jgi:nucleoid DNA-binding protein